MLGEIDRELPFAAVFLPHNAYTFLGVFGKVYAQTDDVPCRSGNRCQQLHLFQRDSLSGFFRQQSRRRVPLGIGHLHCQFCHICKIQPQHACRHNRIFCRCQHADLFYSVL